MTDAAGETACCVRCGTALSAGGAATGVATRVTRPARVTVAHASRRTEAATAGTSQAKIVCDSPTVTIRAPLSSFDTWELDEQLRHVDRILSGARFSTELATGPTAFADSPGGKRELLAAKPAAAPRGARARLAWAIVGTGAAALAAGIILLCAGAVLGRASWQSIGLPITLLGQVALLLGMMMQLDLVWKGKRETASKLYRFQKRLVDLESLAAELTPPSDEALAPPADERQLMAELKSRLDTLSHRLNLPCG